MEFVNWIENSALGIWMVESVWAYPIVLSTHAVGMSIVVGTVIIIDLRLLGYAGNAPLDLFKIMFAVTWVGVVLNFMSGLALLASDPAKFFYHPVFWTKIGLIITGIFSVYLLWQVVTRDDGITKENFVPSSKVKLLACLSLVLWLSVIVAGRLIAYVELI